MIPNGIQVAVADGHGDPCHSLSQWGAQLAVQAALRGIPSKDGMAAVQHQWQADVHRYAYTHGLPAELVHYGTTLQILCLQDTRLRATQIGDGAIWCYHPEQGIHPVLQPTEESVGLTTRSLSVAADLAYVQEVVRDPPGPDSLLLLTTDGLVDSFANAHEWERFMASLGHRVKQYGFSAVCEAVPDWLKHYSQNGCGDDMTVVLIHWRASS